MGDSPGTLVHIGEQKTDETQISLIDYDVRTFAGKGTRQH